MGVIEPDHREVIITLYRLLTAAVLVAVLVPSTAAASAPASCSKTYTRSMFHTAARSAYRYPTVAASKERTLAKVIRCQRRDVSRRIARRVVRRYRAAHNRRFFWEHRWQDVEAWLKTKLARIAGCESGGSPTAVSSNGLYRGKYQFDYGTWASVGGRGDPAAASAREQDVRAAILYGQRGAQPWPVCGQR